MNPFTDPVALENSSYSISDGRELVRGDTGDLASPLSHLVHGEVRSLVLNEHFTCLGGKSAFNHGTYRFGLYTELGSDASAAGLARDLFTFIGEMPTFGDSFSSYI